MADYIEREALINWFAPWLGIGESWIEIHPVLDAVYALPAADVVPVPQEYVYFTTADDENYLVDLTIVVSKKQFDAINSGEDLWTVLRNGGDGNG